MVKLLCSGCALAVLAAGAAVNIDGGRQLFVDDALIASTNGGVRYWNAPVKAAAPVLRPTSEKDGRVTGTVAATNGGLWWDPRIGKYRLWYENDWAGNLRYAESRDGLSWDLPDLGRIKGTNRVFTDELDNLSPRERRSRNSGRSWTGCHTGPTSHSTISTPCPTSP